MMFSSSFEHTNFQHHCRAEVAAIAICCTSNGSPKWNYSFKKMLQYIELHETRWGKS